MKNFFSYSEFSAYNYSPEDYYKRYVLGEVLELTPEAEKKIQLGVLIHSLLADPKYPFVKEMKEAGFSKKQTLNAIRAVSKIERLAETEANLFAREHEPPLHAVLDCFDKKNRCLHEYKTTDNQNRWNQMLVDRDRQLSFYAYVYYQLCHQFFREIVLFRINTETGTTKRFLTARGPQDLKHIGFEIANAVRGIQARGWWDLRKSRKEFAERNQMVLSV